MNWQAVIDALKLEAKQIEKRLSQVIKGGPVDYHTITGEQRTIDLQNMQMCIILAKCLQDGLKSIGSK